MRERGRLARFTYHHQGARPRETAELAADHAAVTEGRTLFPSQVLELDDKPVLVSGKHNAKIGSVVLKGPWSGFPIYTLTLEERATCPTSCDLWRACYGNAMHFSRRRRYTPQLMERLEVELGGLSIQHPQGFVVRLHVLGDFPDPVYVEQWRLWSGLFRQIHVFGYTAHAPKSEIGAAIANLNDDFPGRWAIRFSVPPAAPGRRMQATTIWREPEGHTVEEGIMCPTVMGTSETCGTCALCWAPAAADKRIVFVGHGLNRESRVKMPPIIDEADFLAPLRKELADLREKQRAIEAVLAIYDKRPPAVPVVPIRAIPAAVTAPVMRARLPAPTKKLRAGWISSERVDWLQTNFVNRTSMEQVRRALDGLPGGPLPAGPTSKGLKRKAVVARVAA